MTGSVLVAKVQRSRKRVELDGTVKPGASISAGPETEVVILALSTMGHLVDAAVAVARDLRARGWHVTVQPYTFQGVEAVKTLPTTASAMVAAVVVDRPGRADPRDHAVVISADSVAKPKRRPMTQWTSRRFRCDQCGIERVAASMTQHQQRTEHTGRTFLEAVVIDKTSRERRDAAT